MKNTRIISQLQNFSAWYDSIIEHAQLALTGLVKGTIFILPRAWSIWENIQNYLNDAYKKNGIKNVCFPTFINYKSFLLEQKHVEGFAPELFFVNKSNTADVQKQKIVLRPTSEILFCHYFKSTLQSYNQLPILINQWCNVFRAEKNTKAFLRTTEFHWQELHTIHQNQTEAQEMVWKEIMIYQKCLSQFLNIAFISGFKTVLERFAGAEQTYTLESFMPDGQMLQSCTAHDLGINFSKTFNVTFNDINNQKQFPYQTSAGISTRILGSIIMSHGDDLGLVLPFLVAPVQIVILDLINKKELFPNFQKILLKICDQIKNYRYEIDSSLKSFGYKIQNQELIGTPFNIVIGSKELAKNQVLIINRLTKEKNNLSIDQIKIWLDQAIINYQNKMYQNSLTKLKNAIVQCDTWNEILNAIKNNKIALAPWFDDVNNEINFKNLNLGFSLRCIQKFLDASTEIKCIFSQQKANCFVYFARSY